MSDRFKVTLGLIVQGVLAAGLCTLTAVAQQTSTPATAGTIAGGQTTDAKAKTPADQPAADTPAAPADAALTGVAHPDPVTPEVSSDSDDAGAGDTAASDTDGNKAPVPVTPKDAAAQDAPATPAAADVPAIQSGPGSPAPEIQEMAAPAASSPPAAADQAPASSNTPAPADQTSSAPSNASPAASQNDSATPNLQSTTSIPPAASAPASASAPAPAASTADTPATTSPVTSSTSQDATSTNAPPDSTASQAPAPSQDASGTSTAPAAPSNTAAPASTPADSTASQAPAPSQDASGTSAAPAASSTTAPVSTPADGTASPAPASSPDTSGTSTAPSSTAAPASTPADGTAAQTPAPDNPSGTSATPAAATAPATPDGAAAPAASDAPAGGAPTQPAAPADTNATSGAADAAAPATTPAAPAADASASLSDNQAINPSLPAPQVNAPEPPPASRVDLFGGYTYLRPSGTVGTWSFPAQNTRGYIASGTYYFTRHFGVQAEFQHSEYPLGTTGESPAPPYVQLGGVTDSFYTAQAGGVYRFFLGQHFIPFAHATAGAARVAGPKFQPPTWGYGFAGGGGLDVLIPHTSDHVAFRLVQADYGHMHADQGALTEYDLTGGTQDVNALRLSAGLVFRFGEMNPIQSKSLACDATPAEVYAGERVTLAATLRNYKDKGKNPFDFTWVLTGGKQLGYGPVIFVDTAGLAAGTYHATAHIATKKKGHQFGQCGANFIVKPSPAPTLKCSPDPSTVTPGQISVITAYAGSIPQRQLTYSYTTSEGQIDGKDDTAQLHTDGLPPGMATVTCKVVDDLGQSAIATTDVTIAPPSLPPAPKAQPLCTVYFNRDPRRPARVDNEGRACLDDIALTMEQQPDARLVLVGEHSDTEADGQLTAAERAINTRAYLANEKGIDPSRVDVRTSTTPGRQVQTWLLAPGAVFDQPTEGQIDESKITIHGQQYARQKNWRQQKGPVGYGVSHPPKN